MTIIEPIPNIQNIIKNLDSFTKICKIAEMPELENFIKRANDDYYYWSDIRYRISAGVDVKAEEIWAYIKIGRNMNRKSSPIKDKNNKYFTYWIPDCLLRGISDVDKWLGGMITTDQPFGLPERERYIISSLMDEAIASSQLEGASTEYKVAKEMLRTGRKPKDKNEQMIVNNWKALQYIRTNIRNKFSKEKICELQAILTQEAIDDPKDSGKLRTKDDVNVMYRGEVIHIPPKADTLKERIKALCEFANNDDEDNWVHPVIKGAMIHFWLAYDHPFADGNGRTARALMYWYLLSRGYMLFQYLSISRHFVRAPGQYVRAYLHSEHDENDLTYFLVYNLVSIRFALTKLRNYLKHKQKEIVNANQMLIKFRGLNFRQKSLIHHSIQHPDTMYTIEAHRNTHGVAYDTARNDLMNLVSKGFLKKQREGKRLFLFIPSGKALEKLKNK